MIRRARRNKPRVRGPPGGPSADPLQTLCYIRICAESNTLPSGVWRGVDVHPPFLFVGLAMLLYFAPRKARACTSTARGSAEANVPPLESLQRVCRGSAEGLRRVCRAPLQRAAEPPPARCRGYPLHAAEPPLRAAEGTLCTLQSPPCSAQRVPSTRFWTDLFRKRPIFLSAQHPAHGVTLRPGTFLQMLEEYADSIHGRATATAPIILTAPAAEHLKDQTLPSVGSAWCMEQSVFGALEFLHIVYSFGALSPPRRPRIIFPAP